MEEAIETSFSTTHQCSQLNRKIHRKVRRDCYPDHIYKHIISCDNFTDDSYKLLSNSQLYSVLENNDPFDIGSFDVRFSMNKKQRWKLADHLASNIVSYQNDLLGVRVSCLKTELKDCGWRYENDKLYENNKAIDKELVSLKNGQEIHKKTKRANKYDLLRIPKPPKKSGKGSVVRGDFSIADRNEELESDVHVLYEFTTTVWDGRIRDKRNKKNIEIKKSRRTKHSKTIKKSQSYARKFDWFDTTEILQDEINDDNDCDDDYDDGVLDIMDNDNNDDDDNDFITKQYTSHHQFMLKPEDYLEQYWTKISHRKQPSAKNKSNKESFPQWQQPASSMDFVDEKKLTIISDLDFFEVKKSMEKWNETMISWNAELLSYYDMHIGQINLEEYVLKYTKNYKKIDGLIPETYLFDSVIDPEKLPAVNIGERNAYYCISLVPTEKQTAVRWIINSKPELVSGTVNCKYQKSWNPVHLYPTDAFVPVQYLEDDLLKQSVVIESLSSEKEESKIQLKFNDTICGVCLSNNNDGLTLQCGHFFCKICWTVHSRKTLLAENVPIYCLATDCSKFLTLEQALTILPVEQCEKYKRLLWRQISSHDGFFHCVDCDTYMHFDTAVEKISAGKLIKCRCDNIWCLSCKNRAHQPVPCKFAVKYYDFIQENVEKNNKILLHSIITKKCPRCNNGYERYVGCQNVVCTVCKTNFCDHCGNILNQDHGSHYCKKKIKPEEIILLDVMRKNENKFMQVLFQRWLWSYRKPRTRYGQRQYKKKLIRAGLKYDLSFRIYFVALEMLELCEAYIRFTKQQHYRRTVVENVRKTVQYNQMQHHYHMIKFVLLRFQTAIERKNPQKILEWKSKIGKHMHEMIQLRFHTQY